MRYTGCCKIAKVALCHVSLFWVTRNRMVKLKGYKSYIMDDRINNFKENVVLLFQNDRKSFLYRVSF